MKLPRDVGADRVLKVLQGLGYEATRQKGSHVRMRKERPVSHCVTVPLHYPLKTGTLHGILADVAKANGTTIDALAYLL